MQAGCELLSQLVQLAVIDLQLLGLLHHGGGEAMCLATGDDHRVGGGCPAGAPGRDGTDLRVGQWLAGVDAEADGTQQRGERVADR